MSTPDLPALDPYLVSIGEPVEDLSRIAAAQPFRSEGPSLRRQDVEALVGAARGAGAEPPAALVEAELLDGDGGLTDDGRSLAATLTEPDGRVRVESGRGRTPLTFDAYLRGGRALVLANPSPATLVDVPRGQEIVETAVLLGLDHVDAALLPVLIASWVGLAPAWSLATSPTDLPEALVLRRIDDPRTAPPPGADGHLRYLWQQPWFLWTLQSDRLTHGRVMVNAGRAGHVALTQSSSGRAEDGLVGFRPVPSSVLWPDLVACVEGRS